MHKWLWYAKASQMINRKKIRQTFNFQGQSAITKHWFNIDHEWLKENVIKREPKFYKNYIKLNLGVIQHTLSKIWSTGC